MRSSSTLVFYSLCLFCFKDISPSFFPCLSLPVYYISLSLFLLFYFSLCLNYFFFVFSSGSFLHYLFKSLSLSLFNLFSLSLFNLLYFIPSASFLHYLSISFFCSSFSLFNLFSFYYCLTLPHSLCSFLILSYTLYIFFSLSLFLSLSFSFLHFAPQDAEGRLILISCPPIVEPFTTRLEIRQRLKLNRDST